MRAISEKKTLPRAPETSRLVAAKNAEKPRPRLAEASKGLDFGPPAVKHAAILDPAPATHTPVPQRDVHTGRLRAAELRKAVDEGALRQLDGPPAGLDTSRGFVRLGYERDAVFRSPGLLTDRDTYV